jgi:hypothetical protein
MIYLLSVSQALKSRNNFDLIISLSPGRETGRRFIFQKQEYIQQFEFEKHRNKFPEEVHLCM